ncbi:radical SAM protein [Vibrio cyclitrophicus]|uniref:radical SAM protein n=1 Tax=Vibrio cyclitrophicus TaxID=47951 RepID=UPI000C86280A|nr:radical SAM protein [Vibrio cyclitrophicus]PME22017.1 hypothetical protein BCV43_06625 [Vibrio cyclitrophicus]
MIDKATFNSLTPTRLKLIIMPTEQCNFRCTYCYEDFEIGKMKASTVNALKTYLARRKDEVTNLEVEWFGGEPLLARSIIHEVMNDILDKYDEKYVHSSMTTNGYKLTSDVLSELVSKKVTGYQITLDGERSVHDKNRIMVNGKGSFNTIWSNLLSFKKLKCDFNIFLRLHISMENYDSITGLLEDIERNFGNDSRFKVRLKPLGKYGGSNDDNLPVLTGENLDFVTQGFKHLQQNKGDSTVLTTASMLASETVCYASQGNSYVIRANGTISKCTVELNADRNIVGILDQNGTMVLDQQKMKFWTRGVLNEDKKTRLCPSRF